jgi:hypothetical protein
MLRIPATGALTRGTTIGISSSWSEIPPWPKASGLKGAFGRHRAKPVFGKMIDA